MLLGSALDPNDPTTAMLMAGSEDFPMPFRYGGSEEAKPRGLDRSFPGMSSTLAPSALDSSSQPHDLSQSQAGLGLSASNPTLGLGLGLDASISDFAKNQVLYPSGGSSNGSGTATPGMDGGWDAFINDGSWAENAT